MRCVLWEARRDHVCWEGSSLTSAHKKPHLFSVVFKWPQTSMHALPAALDKHCYAWINALDELGEWQKDFVFEGVQEGARPSCPLPPPEFFKGTMPQFLIHCSQQHNFHFAVRVIGISTTPITQYKWGNIQRWVGYCMDGVTLTVTWLKPDS